MKPRHSIKVRLRRCPCCQSSASKKNSGKGRTLGNKIGRQFDRKIIKNEMII